MKNLSIIKMVSQAFPKLFAITRIALKPTTQGPHYIAPGLSPDCHVIEHSIFPVFEQYIQKNFREKKSQETYAFADIGGSKKNDRVQHLARGMRYYIIDIDPLEKDELIIKGDICSCPQVPSNSFDIILNDNLMEHVKQPWEAFSEMGRMLKSGGFCLTRTVFSWNYHPYPEDYWRFTHSALNYLAEKKVVCIHWSLDTP